MQANLGSSRLNDLMVTIVVGVGATAVMDIWGMAREPLLGIAPPDYRLLGRWLGHMAHGRFRHEAIAKALPVRGERLIGWTAHYATGVAFAAALIAFAGLAWFARPTLAPALIVGVTSVAAPFLLMQPGMGMGIAGARTPRPAAVRLQSLVTHVVFGFGLYAAGWIARGLGLS
jgi:hypothetical protein